MTGITEVNTSTAGLRRALAAGDKREYGAALVQLFAFVGTDLAKKKLFGDTLPEHHAFLSPVESNSVQDFLLYILGAEASPAQLFQDLFVLWATNEKQGGYFVDIGAADGQALSNTWLLENNHGWTGLLVEPDPRYEQTLRSGRLAAVDSRCVGIDSGVTVTFECTVKPGFSSVVSAEEDLHTGTEWRAVERTLEIESVTLNDILDEHGAPDIIDYLSIDIEGLELDILRGFDFARRRINIATIEHNYRPAEAELDALMQRHDYTRVLRSMSRFDAWYIHNSVLPAEVKDAVELLEIGDSAVDHDMREVLVEFSQLVQERETRLADVTKQLESCVGSRDEAQADLARERLEAKAQEDKLEQQISALKGRIKQDEQLIALLEEKITASSKMMGELSEEYQELASVRAATHPLRKKRSYNKLLLALGRLTAHLRDQT